MKKKKNNKNYCVVTVRADRACGCCRKTIFKGEKALTTSSRTKGRRWFCNDCISKIKSIQAERNRQRRLKQEYINTVMEQKCLAFGDEGGYLALQDYLGELESEMDDETFNSL